MYPVSQEFHSKITADERRIYGKVEIEYTPTLIETYEGDDLFYIHLLEEREDIDSGSIPVGNISSNEINIRLDNSDRKFTLGNINSPLHGLLKKNLKVRAWLGVELDSGETEWVPLGVFYTIDWSAPESELYCHVTARDRLDQLRETDYSSAKALVAGAALPAPVFTRASTAYKEDGTQVAANVPRFTPQSENMFDGAILIEGETTNLLIAESASFEGGTIGDWTRNGATISIVSNGWHGNKGLKVVSSATDGRAQLDITSKVAVGDTISLTAWARLESGSPRTVSMAITVLGVSTQAVSKTIYSDRWTKFSVTRKLTTLGDGVYIQLFGGQFEVSTGTAIWDGVLLEKGAPTSFTPTTRAAEGLLLPSAGVLDNQEGTIEFDMHVGPGMRNARKTSTKQGATLFSQAIGYMQGIVPIQGFQLIHNPVDEQFEFWSTRYLYEDTIITTPDNLEEGMHRFAIRWSPYEMALFIDHEKKVSAIKPMLPSHLASYSSIGSRYNPPTGDHLGQVNGYIGTVRYSSRWRTNEELSASDPLAVDDSTTLFMGFDGDLVVEPLGTSLYALAEMVLLDAGLNQSEYRIDPQLRDYLVPCVYFEPQSHREMLRQIAEAGLAVVYCDREDGKIRVEIPEAPAAEEIEEAIYIQADDYFQKTNPEAEVKNSISVITLPMIAGENEEMYRSPEQITLSAGEERTITAFYNSAPCFNAEPSTPGVGILILEATHYTWGMTVKLKNSDTISKTFELVVTARPLEVKGKQKITVKDETSIAENGLVDYEFPDNPLVQSTSVAQVIADNLLAVYAPARRDVELTWRGNPALELGDVVCVPEYQRDGIDARGYYVVVQQEFEWDGGLRAKLVGVKVPDAE